MVVSSGAEAPVGLEINAVNGSVRADDVENDILEQRAVNVRDLALAFVPCGLKVCAFGVGDLCVAVKCGDLVHLSTPRF